MHLASFKQKLKRYVQLQENSSLHSSMQLHHAIYAITITITITVYVGTSV